MSIVLRLAIGFMAGIFFILLASSKWRTAGRSLLFILIFEGVFRKWLLPAASDYIYFFKDWILIGSLIGLYRSGQYGAPIRWRLLPIWLWAIAILVSLEALNPVMSSPLAGLMGMKMWLLWPMFIFLLPRLFDDMEQFKEYVSELTVVFFVVAGLAMVQFTLPSSHFLNQYVREQESVASFGEQSFVRVCSTFPYLTGFTNYLTFCPVLFMPAAIYFHGRGSGLLKYVVMPALIGVSSMSGARVMLYYLSIFVPVFLLMGLLGGAIKIGNVLKITLVTGVLTMVLVLSNGLFRDSLEALLQRTAAVTTVNDSAIARSIGVYTDALEPKSFSFFGEGVGATSEPARNIASLAGMPVAPSERYAESEPGRVMVETGLLGLIIWTSFKIYLVFLAWVMFWARKQNLPRAISLAVFLYLVIMFSGGPSYDHTFAPFYWFNIGLLFLMEKLDRPDLGPGWVRPRLIPQLRKATTVARGGAA